jgi:membrane protease subunit HflK
MTQDTGEPNGPIVQSVAIGFRVVYAVTILLAGAWLATGIRPVPPDSQAVVTRFGRIAGVQNAGLVLAWPRPVGEVHLLPGSERQLTLRTQRSAGRTGLEDGFTPDAGGVPGDASGYLTGDGGVVLLAATIYYQVSDAGVFMLTQPHVPPALQRLFRASATTIAARRVLDDCLVARPDRHDGDAAVQARRQAVRGDLTAEMNRRLASLAASGAALGITVSRIDPDATLPPSAKIAFDSVLVSSQMAEQGIAGARTEATRTLQESDRERDRLLAAAYASAQERVSGAAAKTADATALQSRMTPQTRDFLFDQLYRDRLASLLHNAGSLTAVDPRGGRIILPGAQP